MRPSLSRTYSSLVERSPAWMSLRRLVGGVAGVMVARQPQKQRVERLVLLGVERREELILEALDNRAKLRERVFAPPR
jgi:hypothetical protein